MNEADTCRKYVVPKLVAAGWDEPPHSFTEQRTFTDGRIIPLGSQPKLKSMTVPVPSISEQRRLAAYLDGLQAQVDRLKALQAQTAAELEALLPAILDRAFKGEL